MNQEVKDFLKIEQKSSLGRIAVASKCLQPGEIIFSEVPFAFGPKSDTPPVCLGCLTPVDTSNLCSTCQWPVCNNKCKSAPAHKKAECQVFAEAKVKFQKVSNPTDICLQYECITPLRVLLAKERNPERWDKEILNMEAHNDVRKNLPIWNFNQVNIVEYLKKPCKLANRFSEDLIHTVCGLLEVNAFEARAISGYPIRCLYPKLAILSHNCISNITHSIACEGENHGDDFRVTVRATVEVQEGQELFSSYTYSLWPTLVRRVFLKESKYFDCRCARCSDPTELGTHMSTLKCTKCDNGIIMSTDPLDASAFWKCSHCAFSAPGIAIQKVFAAIQANIDAVEYIQDSTGIEVREALVKKYRSALHPRNAYQTILRCSLSQLYGKLEGYTLADLPDILLERKVELCTDLLKVLDVIEPGYSRIRGITLYELHAPLILLARSLSTAGVIDQIGLKNKLEEAMKILEESVNILLLEPPSTTEGALGAVAKKSLQQLKENIDDLIANA